MTRPPPHVHTLATLKAWLADPTNFMHSRRWVDAHPNPFTVTGVRNPFVLFNGMKVSIQQSAGHFCKEDTVEIWTCPPSPLLEAYWEESVPYACVPLTVVVDYLNEQEQRKRRMKDES